MSADERQHEMDPYQSPAMDAMLVDDEWRPLTRGERSVLSLYFEHRNRPFRVSRLLLRMIPNWCLILTAMAILLIMAMAISPPDSELPIYALLSFSSCFLGVFFRDIGIARRLVVMWPMLRDVFDWQRIEARLEQTD